MISNLLYTPIYFTPFEQSVKNDTPSSPSLTTEKINDLFNVAPQKKYTIPKRSITISPNHKVSKTSFQFREKTRVRLQPIPMTITVQNTRKFTIKHSRVARLSLKKLANSKRNRYNNNNNNNPFVFKKEMKIPFDTLTSRATEINHVLGLAHLSVTSGFELAAQHIDKKLVSLGLSADNDNDEDEDDGTCLYKKLVAGAVFFAVRIFNVGPNKLCLKTFANHVGIEVNEMEMIVRQIVSVRGKLVKTEWVEQGIFDFINVAEFV